MQLTRCFPDLVTCVIPQRVGFEKKYAEGRGLGTEKEREIGAKRERGREGERQRKTEIDREREKGEFPSLQELSPAYYSKLLSFFFFVLFV